MKYIFDELRKDRFNIIPVISNITNDDYNKVVKSIIKKDKKGICIRMFRSEIADINSELNVLLNFLEIDQSSVDLLLDLESLEDLTVDEIYQRSESKISEINHLSKCRSFIISGGNFPIFL